MVVFGPNWANILALRKFLFRKIRLFPVESGYAYTILITLNLSISAYFRAPLDKQFCPFRGSKFYFATKVWQKLALACHYILGSQLEIPTGSLTDSVLLSVRDKRMVKTGTFLVNSLLWYLKRPSQQKISVRLNLAAGFFTTGLIDKH